MWAKKRRKKKTRQTLEVIREERESGLSTDEETIVNPMIKEKKVQISTIADLNRETSINMKLKISQDRDEARTRLIAADKKSSVIQEDKSCSNVTAQTIEKEIHNSGEFREIERIYDEETDICLTNIKDDSLARIQAEEGNFLVDDKSLERIVIKDSGDRLTGDSDEVRWRQQDIKVKKLGVESYQILSAKKLYLIEYRHHALRQWYILAKKNRRHRKGIAVEARIEDIVEMISHRYTVSDMSSAEDREFMRNYGKKQPDEFSIEKIGDEYLPLIREYTTVTKRDAVKEAFKRKREKYASIIGELGKRLRRTISYEIVVYCAETRMIHINNTGYGWDVDDSIIHEIDKAIARVDLEAFQNSVSDKMSALVNAELCKRIEVGENMIWTGEFLYYSDTKALPQIQGDHSIIQSQLEKDTFKIMKDSLGKEASFDESYERKLKERQDYFSQNSNLDEIYLKKVEQVIGSQSFIPPRVSTKVISESFDKIAKNQKGMYDINKNPKPSLIIPLIDHDSDNKLTSEQMILELSKSDSSESCIKFVQYLAEKFKSFSAKELKDYRTGMTMEKRSSAKARKKAELEGKDYVLPGQVIQLKEKLSSQEWCKKYNKNFKSKDSTHTRVEKKYSILATRGTANRVEFLRKYFVKSTLKIERPEEIEKYFACGEGYLKDLQSISVPTITEFMNQVYDTRAGEYLYYSHQIVKSIVSQSVNKCTSSQLSIFNRGIGNVVVIMAEGESLVRSESGRPMMIISVVTEEQKLVMERSGLFIKGQFFRVDDRIFFLSSWFRISANQQNAMIDSYTVTLSSTYRRFLSDIEKYVKERDAIRNYFFNAVIYSHRPTAGLTKILKEFQHGANNARSIRSPVESYINSKLTVATKTVLEVYALYKLREYMISAFAGKEIIKETDEDSSESEADNSDEEMNRKVGGSINIISHMTGSKISRFENYLNDNYIVHITTRETTEIHHILAGGVSQLAEYETKFRKAQSNPSLTYSSRTDVEGFKENLDNLLSPSTMFGHNEYLERKGYKLLIDNHLKDKKEEIIAALNNASLFNTKLHTLGTTKGMCSSSSNSTRKLTKDMLAEGESFTEIKDPGNRKTGEAKRVIVEEFKREKVIMHVMRLLSSKPDITVRETLTILIKDNELPQLFEMFTRLQFGDDREIYIQNLLTRLMNMIVENTFNTLCKYIPTEFQTIPGKEKTVRMQEQNKRIWKKQNESKYESHKVYYLNGDATKWSLSDLIECLIIAVDECREFLGHSLAEFCISTLKIAKRKTLRLPRRDYVIISKFIGSDAAMDDNSLKEVVKYMSEDGRSIVATVGWFQGIYNKLSGFKHCASHELFLWTAERLTERSILNHHISEGLTHSDDYNLMFLCLPSDSLKLWSLTKTCRLVFNIKDSVRKTNMSMFIREFISDYFSNLAAVEPYVKYITSLTMNLGMSGYESDMAEALSKITGATDRGSTMMFDDFQIRIANYQVADVYAMRKGRRNDPSRIFGLERDLIPVELGGVFYEESNMLTNIGIVCNDLRLIDIEESREFYERFHRVSQSFIQGNEFYRDDVIYGKCLVAIPSSYSKIAEIARQTYPLLSSEIISKETGETKLVDIISPDSDYEKYRYLVRRFHSVGYCKAFENSSSAKLCIKAMIAVGGKIVSLMNERYSYSEAFKAIATATQYLSEYESSTTFDLRARCLNHNNKLMNFVLMRDIIRLGTLEENDRPIKYVRTSNCMKSIHLFNSVGKAVLYAKYDLKYLIENGFSVKSKSSLEADKDSIKSIVGDDLSNIPELELYKIINSSNKSKSIMKTGRQISSIEDYVLSLYTFNVWPYKKVGRKLEKINRTEMKRVMIDQEMGDERLKATVIRITNYINSRLASPRKKQNIGVLRNHIATMKVGSGMYSKIFSSIPISFFKRNYRLEDILLIYYTAAHLNILNDDLTGFVSRMEFSNRLVATPYRSAPKDWEAGLSNYELEKRCIRVEVTQGQYRLSFRRNYYGTGASDYVYVMLLEVPHGINTMSEFLLEEMIQAAAMLTDKSRVDKTNSLMKELIDNRKNSYRLDTRDLSKKEKEAKYIINPISMTICRRSSSTDCIRELRVSVRPQGMKLRKFDISEEIKMSRPSINVMNYISGDHVIPIRFIDDRRVSRIDLDLTWNGINYGYLRVADLKNQSDFNMFSECKFDRSEVRRQDAELAAELYLKDSRADVNSKEFGEEFMRRSVKSIKKVSEKISDKVRRASKARQLSKLKSSESSSASVKESEAVSEGDFWGFDSEESFEIDLHEVERIDLAVEVEEEITFGNDDDYVDLLDTVRMIGGITTTTTRRNLFHAVNSKGFYMVILKSYIAPNRSTGKLGRKELELMKSMYETVYNRNCFHELSSISKVALILIMKDFKQKRTSGLKFSINDHSKSDLYMISNDTGRFGAEFVSNLEDDILSADDKVSIASDDESENLSDEDSEEWFF